MPVYKDTPTKDGREWCFRVKYKDIFGAIKYYKSKRYKLKKEAEHEERLFLIELGNQKKSGISITFDDIYKEYMVEHSKEIKKQSILRLNNLYKKLDPIKNIKINSFNIEHYKLLKKELEKDNLTTNYLNKVLALLRRLIKYSGEYHNTNENMIRYIKNFKSVNEFKEEMKFFTYEEYQHFNSVIDDPEYQVFFSVLYYMGLRQGEAQALTWKDINFTRKELNIKKTLTTKIKGELYTISTPKTKNSIRTLPMPEIVLNGLKTLYNEYKKYTDFSNNWFVFGGSIPFRETTICKHKSKYCKLANVQEIRIHDFRHSCASLLINNGANITLVSKYLGHSNITITLNTYAHLFESELLNITEKINNLSILLS